MPDDVSTPKATATGRGLLPRGDAPAIEREVERRGPVSIRDVHHFILLGHSVTPLGEDVRLELQAAGKEVVSGSVRRGRTSLLFA